MCGTWAWWDLPTIKISERTDDSQFGRPIPFRRTSQPSKFTEIYTKSFFQRQPGRLQAPEFGLISPPGQCETRVGFSAWNKIVYHLCFQKKVAKQAFLPGPRNGKSKRLSKILFLPWSLEFFETGPVAPYVRLGWWAGKTRTPVVSRRPTSRREVPRITGSETRKPLLKQRG